MLKDQNEVSDTAEQIVRSNLILAPSRVVNSSCKGKTMLFKNHAATRPRNGERVRIRRSWRSPYSGCTGVLVAVETEDSYGAYVVQFDDGMQFRYQLAELQLAVAPSTPFYERVIRVLSHLD